MSDFNQSEQKKRSPKQRFEEMLLDTVMSDNEELLELVNARLFKYKDSGFNEEQSLDFEDNLLIHFYKLSSIENYKNINDILLSGGVRQDYASRYDVSIKNHPSFKVIRNIVEEYQSDWALFLKDFFAEDHHGLDKNPENEFETVKNSHVSTSAEESVSEDLKQAIKDQRQKEAVNSGVNGISRSIELRVLSTAVPSYENVWETASLFDFTRDCYDRSIEMAVSAYLAHKINKPDLAWLALSKAREFLGIYSGARVQLDREKDYLKGIKGFLGTHRTLTFARDSIKRKILSLIDDSGSIDSFSNVDKWQNEKRDINDREYEFLWDLIQNVLIDELLTILDSKILSSKSRSKKTKEKIAEDKYKHECMLEDWIDNDPYIRDPYMKLCGKFVTTRLDESERLVRETIVKNEEGNNAPYIKIDKKRWNALIEELGSNWSAYNARHADCPRNDECELKQRELKRHEKLSKFLSDPLSGFIYKEKG